MYNILMIISFLRFQQDAFHPILPMQHLFQNTMTGKTRKYLKNPVKITLKIIFVKLLMPFQKLDRVDILIKRLINDITIVS